MTIVFQTISGLIFIAAAVPYIRSILNGETKPNRATWIIWGILDWITAFAMHAEGTLNGMAMSACVIATIIIVLSIFKGKGGYTTLDIACFIGSAIGITLWKAYDNAIFGIIMSQSIILLGSIPTFRKTANHPEQENRTAWVMGATATMFGVIGIPQWTWAHAVQPVNALLIHIIMLSLLYGLSTKVGITKKAYSPSTGGSPSLT